MANRGSFGFKNVNGRSIKVTVEKKVSGKFMDKKAPIRIQKSVVAAMNRAGKAAYKATQNISWTPYRTGRLMKSIRWKRARLTIRANIVQGILSANTPYARRQEFENPTKPFYLSRAIDLGQRMFEGKLSKRGFFQSAMFGSNRFTDG